MSVCIEKTFSCPAVLQDPSFFFLSQRANCHKQFSSWNKSQYFQSGDSSTLHMSGKLHTYWGICIHFMGSYSFQNTLLGPFVWIYLEKILLMQQTPLSQESKKRSIVLECGWWFPETFNLQPVFQFVGHSQNFLCLGSRHCYSVLTLSKTAVKTWKD